MKKIHNRYRIISNQKISDRFVHLVLDAPSVVASCRPGQFVNVRVTEKLDPVFRRPFGIYRAQTNLEILYEVVGKGTGILAAKKAGEEIDILGPLGNGFALPGKEISQIVLVAGGMGIAPLLALADTLKNSGKKLMLFYGGRTKEYLFDMKPFEDDGCKIHIATDDGSAGAHGRVSVLFDKIPTGKGTLIYTCGPRPMLKSVQSFAKENFLSGQCSCEEVMACGIGACLGCVIKTVSGYQTVCHDGPVFDLQEVIFE
ncbi:MAG TPA: dihydroorotate dehydrogenase electron transfer subunit [Candidatus Bathyarchaeia archaeon]|nr:dihydroorotate dehydrogenase electron transfer subunit [Candidatus Bathyarchaeia archaeon]